MLKSYRLALLALCAGALGTSAQTVTVVLNDGTSQKFNSDYVKEMTIREVQQPVEDMYTFNSITVEIFGEGSITLNLNDDANNVKCRLKTFGPAETTFLQPGTYTFSSSHEPWTIDNGYYSFFWSMVDGEGKSVNFSEGTVEIAEEGGVYTIHIDATLVNGERVAGTYAGTLPAGSSYYEQNLSAMEYLTNPQPAGTFYVKGHDLNYKIEMAVVFDSGDEDATSLPEGEYTYSADGGVMTFLSKSYIDFFSPYVTTRFTEGKVNVTKNGDEYTVDITGRLDNNRSVHLTYTGSITGTPTFGAPARTALKTNPLVRDYKTTVEHR